MGKSYRWGIIGPGKIATLFAAGLSAVDGAVLYRIASRDAKRAQDFARDHAPDAYCGDYAELIADANVDVVYIATPHAFHKDFAVRCLQAGKAVLCEKPMALNAAQVREIIDASHTGNVFLMEAMWTLFFPLMEKLRQMIADGVIGELRMVHADFGFRCDWDPQGRILDPAQGGGGLLDVGVYPISFFHMLLGKPEEVQGFASVGQTGVDEQASWLFRYKEGQIASGMSAVRTATQHDAWLYGTEGRICIHTHWWRPNSMTLYQEGKEPQRIDVPYECNGYQYEAEAVMKCLDEGKIEHPLMPHQQSLEIAQSMDRLRGLWGVTYPCEQ